MKPSRVASSRNEWREKLFGHGEAAHSINYQVNFHSGARPLYERFQDAARDVTLGENVRHPIDAFLRLRNGLDFGFVKVHAVGQRFNPGIRDRAKTRALPTGARTRADPALRPAGQDLERRTGSNKSMITQVTMATMQPTANQ